MCLLFFRAVYHSKKSVIPHSVIAAILDFILNISKRKKNNIPVKFSKYYHCWKLSENNY